ncbi:hypothetical protein Ancab_006216 [Ancistrocladus abbreviatus]
MEWELSIARAVDDDVNVILSQTISGYDQNLWHLSGNQDDPKVKPVGDMCDEMSTMQEKLAQQHDESQNSQGGDMDLLPQLTIAML